MSTKSPTGSELVYEFQPTTPSGTPSSSPHVENLTLPNYEVQLIQWVVPPGPQGLMGWQLWYSNAVVLPLNGGWIIADNEYATWELDELPTAGALGLDHDMPFTVLRCAPSDRREVHVWRALRGAAPGEVEAGVRAAARAAGVSLEVVS